MKRKVEQLKNDYRHSFLKYVPVADFVTIWYSIWFCSSFFAVNSLARSKYCWQTIRRRCGKSIQTHPLARRLLPRQSHSPLIHFLLWTACHLTLPTLPYLSHTHKTLLKEVISHWKKQNGAVWNFPMSCRPQAGRSDPSISTWPSLCHLFPWISGVFWMKMKSFPSTSSL